MMKLISRRHFLYSFVGTSTLFCLYPLSTYLGSADTHFLSQGPWAKSFDPHFKSVLKTILDDYQFQKALVDLGHHRAVTGQSISRQHLEVLNIISIRSEYSSDFDTTSLKPQNLIKIHSFKAGSLAGSWSDKEITALNHICEADVKVMGVSPVLAGYFSSHTNHAEAKGREVISIVQGVTPFIDFQNGQHISDRFYYSCDWTSHIGYKPQISFDMYGPSNRAISSVDLQYISKLIASRWLELDLATLSYFRRNEVKFRQFPHEIVMDFHDYLRNLSKSAINMINA